MLPIPVHHKSWNLRTEFFFGIRSKNWSASNKKTWGLLDTTSWVPGEDSEPCSTSTLWECHSTVSSSGNILKIFSETTNSVPMSLAFSWSPSNTAHCWMSAGRVEETTLSPSKAWDWNLRNHSQADLCGQALLWPVIQKQVHSSHSLKMVLGWNSVQF